MLSIKKEDIITCESYKGLCDSVYKIGDKPKSGLIHVNLEEMQSFFEYCKENPYLKFVVVSSCSDFGVTEQLYNQPCFDLIKWARMCVTPEIGYNGINIGPRCDVDKCKLSDKYSVKCYAWTTYTFNNIPSNIVRWFTTNCQTIDDNRIIQIPFGVPANSQDDILNQIDIDIQKRSLVYVNWTNYTYERAELESYYQNSDFATVIKAEEKKPYKEYLMDLAQHHTVISPCGNGIDCYRNLEAIYLGVLPLVDNPSLALTYRELPMLVLKSLFLSKNAIKDLVEYGKNSFKDISYEKVKLSYWKEVFENERLRINVA